MATKTETLKTVIKVGDTVMVIAGGNSKKRANKGKTGKVLRFSGKNSDRVIVEGLNFVAKHQKQTSPDKPGGKIVKEAPIHLSNVMYYVEALKKPVRLCRRALEDGKRVRGYVDNKTKKFVQIAEQG